MPWLSAQSRLRLSSPEPPIPVRVFDGIGPDLPILLPVAPTLSSAIPAPSATAPQRAGILALGQSGRVWDFVPLAVQLLQAAPADVPLRLMLAAAYGRLGLRTAALQQLDRVDALTASIDPGSASLRRAAANLPDDRVPFADREARLAANLAVLESRGLWTGGIPPAWRESRAAEECFRLREAANPRGVLLRRAAHSESWIRFADDLGHARAVDLRAAGWISTDGTGGPRPVYLEGIDPPWLLQRLAAELQPRPDSACPPIIIIQEDPLELCDGLATSDLQSILAHPRLRIILGPNAGTALETFLRDWGEAGCRIIGGHTLTLPATRSTAQPPIGAVVDRVSRSQVEAVAADRARAEALYASRTPAWWAERFRAARAGEQPPLRVLIPTTRYSTYIQHAAADLAAGLRASGADARVLMEPDEHSSLAATAITRQIAHWQPDLLIQINYPRSSDLVPANLPWLCWIQDAMPHLFTAQAGAAQRELDFVAGHLHADLFDRFGWPRARALATPVVASAAKFHRGPITADHRARFACDVAVATNHSQTPADFLRHWLAAPGDAALKAAVQTLGTEVERIAAESATHGATARLALAVEASLTAHGIRPEPELATRLMNQVARPLADRFIRHQTIHWAAAICARRGWRLHLYGRGWSQHPTLAHLARGEALHGEDLRAAYQAAAVHLHASINGNIHQRLAECALSGGLPLVRVKHDDLNALLLWTQAAMCARGQCTACTAPPLRVMGALLVDGPETLRWTTLQQRLGLPLPTGYSLMADPRQWDRPWMFLGDSPIPEDEAWLMGDLSQTGFRDEHELEAALDRAITSPDWRESLSRGIAERAARAQSIESLAPRLLGLVAAGLSGA
jgi:hypothetical protein